MLRYVNVGKVCNYLATRSLRAREGGVMVHFRALPENEPPFLFFVRAKRARD
ncbi:MAG: hypothetical protein U5L45_18735 [Saprospiraceae bacterium]|nr:hypothetical protein [Saprospiraceae bacterium]